MLRKALAPLLAAFALFITPAAAQINDVGAHVTESLDVRHSHPGRLLESGARVWENEVTVTVKPRFCEKIWECGRIYHTHNSRVDSGASYLANVAWNSGSAGIMQYIAVTPTVITANKLDTALSGEYTNSSCNGFGRKQATFGNYTNPAVLGGTAQFTLSVTFNSLCSYTISTLGLFNQAAPTGSTMMFESSVSPISGGSGDIVNVVWTVQE